MHDSFKESVRTNPINAMQPIWDEMVLQIRQRFKGDTQETLLLLFEQLVNVFTQRFDPAARQELNDEDKGKLNDGIESAIQDMEDYIEIIEARPQ